MNKQKLSQLKTKARIYRPEILAGAGAVLAVGAVIYAVRFRPSDFTMSPEKLDSILVLEQISLMTFRDLDTGDFFHVTKLVD